MATVKKQINVPKDVHRHIIGAAGAVIRELQTTHSVKITIPGPSDPSDVVSIDGSSEDSVAAAIEAINRIAANRAAADERRQQAATRQEVKVAYPKEQHRVIIGTGGRNVQQLQSSTGAHITVPRSDDASDLVTIRGSPDQIAAAQREIAALLTTPAASSSSSSSSTSSSSSPSMGGAAARRLRDGAKSDVLLVPKEQHKYVIGPGGKTIRALRESTGAEIQLPAQGDDSEFVQLIGSDEQIAAARAGITEALAQVQLEREKRQREYQEHTDKYYQFYQDKVSHYVRKRSAFFQQAEEAFRAGNGALAKELSLKGKAITAKIEKAQQEGAQALFKAKNKGRDPDSVDLHGLHVAQAVQIVEEKLANAASMRRKGYASFHIITGKGLHSEGGEIKLLPAVIELLDAKRFTYEHKPEEGVVDVML